MENTLTKRGTNEKTKEYTGLQKKQKVDLALLRTFLNKQITLDAYEFVKINTTKYFNKSVNITTYRTKIPMQLHEESINAIVKQVRTFFIVEKKINQSISVRLYFSNIDYSFHKNIVISKTDFEMNQIAPKLFNFYQKATVFTYHIYLKQIDVMLVKYKKKADVMIESISPKLRAKKIFTLKLL